MKTTGKLRLARKEVKIEKPEIAEGESVEKREPKQQAKRKTAMTSEKPQNLQDQFLNHIRKQKTPVTVFLINGVKLQGIVTWFDNFCVLLRRDQHSQLVYKHAISTVMPATPVQLFDPEAETAAAAG
jgi:host factor-I protein